MNDHRRREMCAIAAFAVFISNHRGQLPRQGSETDAECVARRWKGAREITRHDMHRLVDAIISIWEEGT